MTKITILHNTLFYSGDLKVESIKDAFEKVNIFINEKIFFDYKV